MRNLISGLFPVFLTFPLNSMLGTEPFKRYSLFEKLIKVETYFFATGRVEKCLNFRLKRRI